jgi:hypothetical protein
VYNLVISFYKAIAHLPVVRYRGGRGLSREEGYKE